MITGIKWFGKVLCYQEDFGNYHEVPSVEEPKKESHVHKHPHKTIDPCYCEEEPKKEEKLSWCEHMKPDEVIDWANMNWKYCPVCATPRPKPEEKRKKLFDVMLRAYKDAPEVTADGSFPYVATAVIADLEKRIDEFVRIESREYGEYKTVGDLRDFIRKEWLGE